MEYITIHQWLPLKKETREKLKEIFYLKSTGMVEVETDQFGKSTIKNDGFTNTDLQVITVEKLVDYLGTAAVNETIYDLWKLVVEKVEMPEKHFLDELKEPLKPVQVINPEVLPPHEGLPGHAVPMNTADNQLKCVRCPFVTGSSRGLKIHSAKHNRIKVA